VKIELSDEIARHGPDAFRYFLMREIPFDGDGNYSVERFEAVYTAELANGLGNLASRVIAMIEKYRGAVVPAGGPTALDNDDLTDAAAAIGALDGSRGFLCHEALEQVHRITSRANLFIQQSAPWTLAKDPAKSAELDAVLAALARSLARQAVLLSAFMPGKAEALWQQLGGAGTAGGTRYEALPTLDAAGWKVSKGEGLFPRGDDPSAAS